MTDNEKSILKDSVLFLGSFFLFVYIHLPLTLRFGYNVDEILDYTGSQMAQDVYLSCGRWGLVLWSWLVGGGIKPWSGGITAGLILCLALILQTKILFPAKTPLYHKVIYCTLYLGSYQFAYTLCYSMQAEGFALSILFSTLACFVLFSTQNHSFLQILSAIGLLFLGLSFYQTSGLLFFSLFLYCLLNSLDNNSNVNLTKALCILIIICTSSIILFLLTKKIILSTYPCDNPAILFVHNHEENNLKQGLLFTNASLLHLLKNRFYSTISCNLYLQICTLIALVIWTYHMVANRKFTKLCIMMTAIVMPYIATLFAYAATRTFLFIPLISAFCIIKTISLLQSRHRAYWWIIPSIIICISAAHKVSEMSLIERTRHDNNLMERFIQYSEARKIMLESGLDNTTSKIIVFEKGWNEKAPNFYHSYPFQNFHLGTYKDYETYQHILNNMPCWPASGSIVRDENVILIKGQSRW